MMNTNDSKKLVSNKSSKVKKYCLCSHTVIIWDSFCALPDMTFRSRSQVALKVGVQKLETEICIKYVRREGSVFTGEVSGQTNEAWRQRCTSP